MAGFFCLLFFDAFKTNPLIPMVLIGHGLPCVAPSCTQLSKELTAVVDNLAKRLTEYMMFVYLAY
jgi:hypothetical protein